MKKGSVLLLISLIIGVAYAAYSLSYWFGDGGAATSSVGGALATALVGPHLAVMFVAVVFNALAFFVHKSVFALVAGILYAVSMVLFIGYFMFVVLEMILCFVAYARMHGEAKRQQEE